MDLLYVERDRHQRQFKTDVERDRHQRQFKTEVVHMIITSLYGLNVCGRGGHQQLFKMDKVC